MRRDKPVRTSKYSRTRDLRWESGLVEGVVAAHWMAEKFTGLPRPVGLQSLGKQEATLQGSGELQLVTRCWPGEGVREPPHAGRCWLDARSKRGLYWGKLKEGDHRPGPGLCDVARENHTFWDHNWAREPVDFFTSIMLTDAGAAGKPQVSPFRVNLELSDNELMTGSETSQVLERFCWEKAAQREIKNCFTCPPLTSCFVI